MIKDKMLNEKTLTVIQHLGKEIENKINGSVAVEARLARLFENNTDVTNTNMDTRLLTILGTLVDHDSWIEIRRTDKLIINTSFKSDPSFQDKFEIMFQEQQRTIYNLSIFLAVALTQLDFKINNMIKLGE